MQECIKDIEEVFDDYMTWGGMPQRFMMTDEIQTRTYLSDIIILF